MEILSKDATITEQVPKIIETPNYIVLNTQIYEKGSFQPVPFNFFKKLNGNIIFQLYRMITTNHNINSGSYPYLMQYGFYNAKRIIFDSTDSQCYYQISQLDQSGTRFQKLTETLQENKVYINQNYIQEIVGSVWQGGHFCNGITSYGQNYYFLCQTKDYIIINEITLYGNWSGDWAAWHGRNYRLARYNKITNEYVYIKQSDNYTIMRSYELIDINSYGMFIFSFYNGTIEIYNIQVDSNISRTILSTTIAGQKQTDSNITSLDGYKWFIALESYVNDVFDYCLYRFAVDYPTENISYIKVPINKNGIILDDSSAQNWNGIVTGVYHHTFSFTIDNDKYIVVVIHSQPNYTYYPEQHKIMVFKISTYNDSAFLVYKHKFKNGCRGVLEYTEDDPTILVTLHDEGYRIFKFNHTSEQYETVYAKGGIFYALGFDTYGRFYTQDDNGRIELITTQNAVTLKSDFEDEIYTRNNGDIITNIYYYAKNIFNEYVSVNIVLTLIGNVKFQDNTKIKTINTSIIGSEKLPVIIYGTGKIEVLINLA